MNVLKRPRRQKQTRKPNVYAFIDSQNLNLGVQKVGWKMDWRAFHQLLKEKYNVTKAFMFIGYIAENEALYEHMHQLGYLIALKPTVDSSSVEEKEAADYKPVVKGNIDADLVLYAMKELPNYDKAIIVSGDGDFASLIEYLIEQNKLLYVMTPNWQYSSLLKPFEQYLLRIDQMRSQLAYRDRRKRNNNRKDDKS